MKKDKDNLNIFMMCDDINFFAFSEIPNGYYVKNCSENEVDNWIQLITEASVETTETIKDYFNTIYAPKKEIFYQNCKLLYDTNNELVATCFLWKAYESFYTIHWLKVRSSFEGKGLGRVILSYVLKHTEYDNTPLFLHTQPSSYQAIKLYTDFGFKIIVDSLGFHRNNDYKEALPYLAKSMTSESYKQLEFIHAPEFFINILNQEKINKF